MTLRPKLKAGISQKDFRKKLAEMASDFAREIELSVESFDPDPSPEDSSLSFGLVFVR